MLKKSIKIALFFVFIFITQMTFTLELAYNQSKDKSYLKERYQSIKDRLLKCPKWILETNRDLIHKMHNLFRDHDFQATEINSHKVSEIINKLEERSPIFALNECPCTDKDRLNSHYREPIESEIVNEIIQNNEKKESTLNYVSLGSGYCFQDLVIITKLLENNIRKINLHLIDTAYDSFIEFKKSSKLPITFNIFYTNIIFEQLTNWFKTNYPNSEIRIFIYDNIESYKAFIESNSNLKSDITVGIDFTRDGIAFYKMINDFRILLEYNFLKNKNSLAFYDIMNGNVCKFASNQIKNCKPDEFTLSEEERIKALNRLSRQNNLEPIFYLMINKSYYTSLKIIDKTDETKEEFKNFIEMLLS